jgi:hypothetical protein
MGEEASNTIALVKGEAKTGRLQQSVLSGYRWCLFSIIDHMSGKEGGSKDGIGDLIILEQFCTGKVARWRSFLKRRDLA